MSSSSFSTISRAELSQRLADVQSNTADYPLRRMMDTFSGAGDDIKVLISPKLTTTINGEFHVLPEATFANFSSSQFQHLDTATAILRHAFQNHALPTEILDIFFTAQGRGFDRGRCRRAA